MLASIIVNPEQNSPIAIITRLFGRRRLGPTRKFETPQKNSPTEIIWTGLINLDRYGATITIIAIPANSILNMSPCINLESVSSATLKDSKGSK